MSLAVGTVLVPARGGLGDATAAEVCNTLWECRGELDAEAGGGRSSSASPSLGPSLSESGKSGKCCGA